MLTILADMAQPSFEEESKHFSEEEDSNPPIKLKILKILNLLLSSLSHFLLA